MHTEKKRIFDEYARSKGYYDWEALQMDYETNFRPFDEFRNDMFAACDLVQQEHQKRIAENAIIEPKGMMTRVDKDSILNNENIIK